MKISLDWLSDYMTWTEKDPQIIADRITLGTAEVEEVEIQGALLNNVCVGEIVSMKQHPNADRLRLLEVKTDKGMKNVVCGGTNLYEGMQIAFAHIGATVKHGSELVTLQAAKIRGEASEGMVCAAEELDLTSAFPPAPEHGERPVIDLKGKGYTTGESLKKVLGMNDTVLHINNTAITTRPDLFSHLGFARECVALGLGTWKKPVKAALRPTGRSTRKPAFAMPKGSSKKGLTMKIDAKTLVPRYLGCSMTIEGLGETPDWMKRRLEALGSRSVSLPVDITNYVSADIGVPLHSFDADDIEGTVHMRLSTKGEKIKTLDSKEFTLPEGVLILSDDKGVFDLVGIMGGLRSSTKDSTKHIFLQALSLDPATIRRAIIGTGHRTDASTVYEKGVPPVTAEQGFIRAVELFLELVPGAAISSPIMDEGDNGKPKAMTVNTDEISNTLGMEVKEKDIVDTLKSLEFDVVKGTKKGQLKVTAPLHRLRDITGVHDIVEEVGRIRGFEGVPTTMPVAPVQLPARDKRVHALRDALKETGYWETVPLALVSPAILQKAGFTTDDAVAVVNPIGEETSLLHTSTLPALLKHAQENLPLAQGELRTFQWANTFHKEQPETLELTMLLTAKVQTDLLSDPFLHIKQNVLRALTKTGYDVRVSETKDIPAHAHPGRIADLLIGKTVIGSVYEVHPSVRAKFDLPFRAAAVTLNLSALLALPAAIPVAKSIPAFPAITYDVTVKRTQDQALGKLLNTIRNSSPLLETVHVQDLYAGKPLTGNEYNLTLRFVYRSPEKTLTEDEAKSAHQKVLTAAGIA